MRFSLFFLAVALLAIVATGNNIVVGSPIPQANNSTCINGSIQNESVASSNQGDIAIAEMVAMMDLNESEKVESDLFRNIERNIRLIANTSVPGQPNASSPI